MNVMKDYYNILGIKQDASFENIRRAYDRERFEEGRYFDIELEEAYYVLSDYDRRKEYDKKMEQTKNNIYSDSSYTAPNFSSVEQEPPVVEQDSPVVEQEPPVVEQESLVVEQEPLVVEQDSPEVEQTPPVVEQESPVVEQEPPVVEQEPPVVEQEPPVVEQEILPEDAFITKFNPIKKNPSYNQYMNINLVKERSSKEITEIWTEEMQAIAKYNETLDKEINELLSRPYNNYKLQINKRKYELQVELLNNLLNIKRNTPSKKGHLAYKMDLISTKMQLESAKNNLENVKKKISEYEGKQMLTNLNNNLISINMNLAAEPKKNSIKIHSLEIKQGIILELRDMVAKNTKARVIRLGSFYDKMVKAKDFVKSFKYIVKSDEETDDFINSGSQRIR